MLVQLPDGTRGIKTVITNVAAGGATRVSCGSMPITGEEALRTSIVLDEDNEPALHLIVTT